MASQEKILKSLDHLKKLSQPGINSDWANRKKEKIQHCHIITECISNHALQTTPHLFSTLLSNTMETLFELCDDSDSDIRMVAEECLNKMIRALNNENITKVLIELHKEIKRNKSARSLRAALTRFSKLAHCIRPHKGKPYVNNLFPSLIKIIERQEELIHETLSNSLPKIIEVLGPFTTDNDIKNLLKSFMANVSNPSALIRRTTVSSICNICLNCPRPYSSIVYCIHIFLGFMFPLIENCDVNLILGVMGILKLLLPHLKKFDKEKNSRQTKEKINTEWGGLQTEKLLQIYELCLHYVNQKDHNLVNASLETLNVLLQNCTTDLRATLLNPTGISRLRCQIGLSTKHKSSSQLSMASGSNSLENLLESDLAESIRPDIAKWIDESKLTVLNASDRSLVSSGKSSSFENPNNTALMKSFSYMDLESSSEVEAVKPNDDVRSSRDRLEVSTTSSENSACDDDVALQFSKDVYIGELDDEDVSLIYCTRLLAKRFLLSGIPGHLVSDRVCRISVRSSALSCLSSILRLYPKVLLEYLDKRITKPTKEDQAMSDVLLYSNHSDPQLKGVTRMLIASYLASTITQNRGGYDDRIVENLPALKFESLIATFLSGLEDSSSLCVRHTIQSLDFCLDIVLESNKCKDAIPILLKLPPLATNPYWLIKVSLCELISHLPYITIEYVTGDNLFQNKVLNNIVLELIKDPDSRIRKACCNAFLKLIPQLYFRHYRNESVVTSKAISYKKMLLSNLHKKSWLSPCEFKHILEAMPFPYGRIDETASKEVEFALSVCVRELTKMVLHSRNEYELVGCIETLALMSQVFPCTVFKHAWNCEITKGCGREMNDLLQLGVDVIYYSSLTYDIGFHTNLLLLCSNLYAGFSISVLRIVPEDESVKKWSMFESSIHSNLSETYLKHVVKMLSIYQHVIDDIYPATPTKPIMLNLPTASPIKRRKSDLDKKFISPSKLLEDKNEKKEKEKNLMGNFWQIPHYMKIHDAIKTAYGNYKTSLESEASEKFLNLLRETLKSLSTIMEIGGLSEFGNIADELLNYLNTIFKIEPSSSVECVQQLLRSIFGTNLLAYGKEMIQELDNASSEKNCLEDSPSGFYYQIFLKPYNEVSMCINSLKDFNKVECVGDSTVMGYRHRNTKRRIALTSNLDKVLANYIRIFEPMVIKSLKQYTITSDVKLQGQVLQLLSQLVQIKINYCLLDADQIFINFVLGQFEYIEGGQIGGSPELVQKIFQFLVQLSYSKQHSKSIISIPKIIQLCDGLTASGQCPLTHCIPAFKPIVDDIFFTRNTLNTPDTKELETTREVVFAMLLKLIEYHEVVELVILILDDSKYCSDTDKWLRWSKNVLSSLISALKEKNKYKLDSVESLNSLRKLVFVLHPDVFKPIDNILLMLFEEPPQLQQDIIHFTRWMGKIITILLILSPVEEEAILSKIATLKNNFVPNSVFENVVVTSDPLNVTNSADFFQHLTPEIILIRFIFRTLTLASRKCSMLVDDDGQTFFFEELSIFMMMCVNNLQSGFLCKTANTAISIIEKSKYAEECDAISMEPLNENFQSLIFFQPTLTFQWCYFLILLGYNELTFWSSILQVEEDNEKSFKHTSNYVNAEIVKVGGSIVFCEYLYENSKNETDDIYWLLDNKLNILVELIHEDPVNEFFSFVHRDSRLGQNLLKNVEKINLEDENLIYKLKILEVVENVHPNLTGQLIKFLLERMICVRDVAVTKEILKIATRKLELLLTIPLENVHSQLRKEDLIKIISSFTRKEFNTKFEVLLGLLNKLASRFYNINPQITMPKCVNSDIIKYMDIDKTWYLSQIRNKLSSAKIGREVADLLSVLHYEELMEVMQAVNFDRLIWKYCIENAKKNVDDLSKASLSCLWVELNKTVKSFSNYSQSRKSSEFDERASLYKSEFFKEFNILEMKNTYLSIIPCVLSYLESAPCFDPIEVTQAKDIIQFSLLSLEFINYCTEIEPTLNVILLDYSLQCFKCILKQDTFFNILNSESSFPLCCTAVSNIFKIMQYILRDDKPLEKFPEDVVQEILKRFENNALGESCLELYSLLYWFYRNRSRKNIISSFLLKNLCSIIISLGRLSVFNTFMLVPVKAWNKSLEFNPSSVQNPVIPIPVELLQDMEILEEYIFRVTILGWNSRQQFEETWMCLLSVLCHTPSDESGPEEINEVYTCISLAVKGITSMLVQTLYYPVPGKGNISKLLYVSRNTPIHCCSSSVTKLKNIHSFIKHKYNQSPYFLDENISIESPFDDSDGRRESNKYSCGQLSIKYFLIAIGMVDENCSAYKVWTDREEMLKKCGLDVTSCLQFLQDFYSQLLQFQMINSLSLLQETVNSVLILSDLFNDKSQFDWMLGLFLDLMKIHAVEDELLHRYLLIGVCKAAAVLNPELEVYETIKKYISQFLKCSLLPTRIACLQGLLYILEGYKLSNISIGGISEELQMILPCAIEYIQNVLNSSNRFNAYSLEHHVLVWTVAFYIIENFNEADFESSFIENVLSSAISVLTETRRDIEEYNYVMKGLQRLIILKSITLEKNRARIVKLSLDGLKNPNPFIAISSMQMLFTYMYIEYAEHVETHHVETNPENLEQTIEKFSALFEDIKRGYIFEVEIVCSLLPCVLDDFFTPAEILTKVIGEFLSTQQPHQKLLSKVVFHIFQSAIQQKQLTLLQDWIVFSLPNFTQNFSYPMATWCLTCFFISASCNKWLISLFPYVQTRIQRYEHEDREMLCVAGSDFYRNLSTEKQKQTFRENFKMVRDLPEMPFNDLLSSL